MTIYADLSRLFVDVQHEPGYLHRFQVSELERLDFWHRHRRSLREHPQSCLLRGDQVLNRSCCFGTFCCKNSHLFLQFSIFDAQSPILYYYYCALRAHYPSIFLNSISQLRQCWKDRLLSRYDHQLDLRLTNLSPFSQYHCLH